MSYEIRGFLLETLCKPCDEKYTCKFGCDKWEKLMKKLADETEN